MSNRIRLRSWSPRATPATEIPAVGEPFWDNIRSCLGVFNNRGGIVEWYPRVFDAFILNRSQPLRGEDTSGNLNPIALDFNTSGRVSIVNTATGDVIAAFGPGGAAFMAVTSAPPAPVSSFMTNRLVNSGLNVPRRFLPSPTYINTDDDSFVSMNIIRPGWHLWKATGSPGKLSLRVSTSDVPSIAGVQVPGIGASLVVTSSGAPTAAGVRLYCYDYASMRGRTLTASAYVKGPSLRKTQLRILTETGGVLATTTYIGTGSWERVFFPFTTPSYTSKWLAFDALYNPGFDSGSLQDWYVSAPQINESSVIQPYEARSAEAERALLRSIYHESYRTHDETGSTTPKIYMLDLIDIGLTPRLTYTADDNTSFLTPYIGPDYVRMNKTVPGGTSNLKLLAYLAPTTSETI